MEGTAARADGSPIPVADLASEVRHKSPLLRASGRVAYTAGNSWTATYRAPYTLLKDTASLSDEQRKQLIIDGDHSMTHSDTPAEVTIAELGAGGGPAPGCEAAPLQADAVTFSDDRFVTLLSGDLVLSEPRAVR